MKAAVITARGGSKHIPRKNVRPFAGKPMIAWSIECALASGAFDAVVVSTDDAEIAQVATAHSAEVPFLRPAHLADDHATTAAVMAHAAEALVSRYPELSELCCLYPTAPLLTSETLRGAGARFADGGWDYVFSAARFSFPPQRGLVIEADGGVRPWQPEAITRRSQDLTPIHHDAGQFYWGSAAAWREQRALFGPRSHALVLPPWQVCDIDTPEDWDFAERLFAAQRGAGT